MTRDATARLLAANPVQGEVAPPPIEPILERLEAREPDAHGARSRARLASWGLTALGVIPVAVVIVVVVSALGGRPAAPAGSSSVAHHRCRPAFIHRGAPPEWASTGFFGGSAVPYALASGDSAVAFFFKDPLRAGHPSNPFNKVLWVLRSVGTPLTISARWGANPAVTAQIRPRSDATPRADYPSYVNLPRAGCWTLDLAWGGRRASIAIEVAPARRAR